MITAWLVGDGELVAQLDAMPARLRSGLARAVARLGLELQRRVQGKLSGEVLKVRTGVLRSSIHFTGPRESASAVSGTVGTAVRYARFHEFGVAHSWLIEAKNAKALRFRVGGETLFRRAVVHGPLPERSFLRSALREMTPAIREGLEEAVRQATALRR